MISKHLIQLAVVQSQTSTVLKGAVYSWLQFVVWNSKRSWMTWLLSVLSWLLSSLIKSIRGGHLLQRVRHAKSNA